MFKRSVLSMAVISALSLSLVACNGDDDDDTPAPTPVEQVKGFAPTAFYAIPSGVPEIIVATPDGDTLVYSNSEGQSIGFLDISNPAQPQLITEVNVAVTGDSEPTSVAVSPDGQFAFVGVRNGDDVNNRINGTLRVYNISNLSNITHAGDITIGVGPDSVAVANTPIENGGHQLQIVVAIEDEEGVPENDGDAMLNGYRPGQIDVIKFNASNPSQSVVTHIDPVTHLVRTEGANFGNDPQPEFVAIHPDQTKAAVTLQENNAMAIIDLADPDRPKLEGTFSLGGVSRSYNADVNDDNEISMSQSWSGRREADAVTYLETEQGAVLATANEGDTSVSTFGDGVYSGGRGFTIFGNPSDYYERPGHVLFDSGAAMEHQAVIYGHYPDGRSGKKGIEVEGITSAKFSDGTYLFAASERGSFVSVYRVNDATSPEFVQFLPTGISPEGVTVVQGRSDAKELLVTSNEVDGTINIFTALNHAYQYPANEPIVKSTSVALPWAALSGLTHDGVYGRYIYAVHDNALGGDPDATYGGSRIYGINMNDIETKGEAIIDKVVYLTLNGERMSLDMEGIAYFNGGFVIAHEGADWDENAILITDTEGHVEEIISLPTSLLSQHVDPSDAGSYGFEGVAIDSTERYIYVAMQRGFDIDDGYGAILRYDRITSTWLVTHYPLDSGTSWSGISEIVLRDDGTMLVLERDKGQGSGSVMKRIYQVSVAGLSDGQVLEKSLVKDLRANYNYLQEKAEGMTLFRNDIWVVNDNDGANWTRLINVGQP